MLSSPKSWYLTSMLSATSNQNCDNSMSVLLSSGSASVTGELERRALPCLFLLYKLFQKPLGKRGMLRLVYLNCFLAVRRGHRHQVSINLEGAGIGSSVQLDVNRVARHVKALLAARSVPHRTFNPG